MSIKLVVTGTTQEELDALLLHLERNTDNDDNLPVRRLYDLVGRRRVVNLEVSFRRHGNFTVCLSVLRDAKGKLLGDFMGVAKFNNGDTKRYGKGYDPARGCLIALLSAFTTNTEVLTDG